MTPMAAAISPLSMFLLLIDATMVRPKKVRAAYSGLLKLVQQAASNGEKSTKATQLTRPPTPEEMAAQPNASAPRPFWAIG